LSDQEEFPPEMPPEIKIVELNELFVQRMEEGAGRLKLLSVVTLIVAVLLLASYASQVILPFATGQTTVTVNLLDPYLLVFEGLLILLTIAWVYVGAVNFLWARRLGLRIAKVRTEEDKILKKIEG
jgi:hypothetical protein